MVFKKAEKRHHDAGGTITTLTAVCINHHPLDGVKYYLPLTLKSEILNRDELLPMDHREENQA